ncbi:MAG: cytochrome c [Planctomycetes bacterium]|nr:cytochrome c [Planctomycetota bacterium]
MTSVRPMSRFRSSAVLAFGAVLLAGCGERPADGAPRAASGGATPVVSSADRAEARQLFDTLCSTCHGNNGHGDGPASAGLEPKPRSFADRQWQASVDDAHIRTVITLGGAAVGKSPNMPPQPQLKSRPGVVQGLAEIIRAQGR